MDKEQLNSLVESIVLSAVSENQDKIVKELAQNLNWSDWWEKTVAQAAFNSVKASTALSVQILLDILLQTGLFKISEEITCPRLEFL